MNHRKNVNETSHEQLRREIEIQIVQFLREGGVIDCLASPDYQADRSVRFSASLLPEY